MKKRNLLYIAVSFMVLLCSCKKYLDQIPDNILKEEDIFQSLTNTQKYLAQVYANIPDDYRQRFAPSGYSGPWTAASDEGNYWSWSWNLANQLNQSTWDDAVGSTYWSNFYKPVRTATDFINKIDAANPEEVTPFLRTHYKAEARALRAIFYYWMVRLYGPVIILPETVSVSASDEEILRPRTPFDSCITYIVNQLDTAYQEIESVATPANPGNLPIGNNNDEFGRITTGICKAYQEQALMLQASPLFNGNQDLAGLKNPDGTALTPQSYDAGKWKLAADAAKSFIDEFVPKTYSLYQETGSDSFQVAYNSCKNVVLNDWNSEWIFGKSRSGSVDNYRYDITPKLVGYGSSVYKGAGSLAVNQSMVDAYFTKNGRSISDPLSGYVSSGFSDFQAPFDVKARQTYNQWINREPRFYVGVTYNRSYWLNQGSSADEVIVNMELSGNSGRKQSTTDVSSTGYIVRKNLSSSSSARGWCMLRLAQIYLDYAEALNESDPGNSDILKYVNLVRARAGVPLYGNGSNQIAIDNNQSNVRNIIRKERQIELAFEGVRYFDIRRWKIASSTMGEDVYGMNTLADGNDFYVKSLVQKRRFLQRDYLWPIPSSEILKDKYLVQNPGW